MSAFMAAVLMACGGGGEVAGRTAVRATIRPGHGMAAGTARARSGRPTSTTSLRRALPGPLPGPWPHRPRMSRSHGSMSRICTCCRQGMPRWCGPHHRRGVCCNGCLV